MHVSPERLHHHHPEGKWQRPVACAPTAGGPCHPTQSPRLGAQGGGLSDAAGRRRPHRAAPCVAPGTKAAACASPAELGSAR